MSTVDPYDLTPAEKRTYLRALSAAIARGVDYVSYGGDQIKHRSLAEMKQIRDDLRHELGLKSMKRRHPRSRVLIVRGLR